MNDFKFLEIGTNVKFGMDMEFRGEITAVNIRETSNSENKSISYEVTHWKDAELKTIWLYERNFIVIKNKQSAIGFKKENE